MTKVDNPGIMNYLFGSWDRRYTFISIILSLISFALTLFLWQFPEKIPYLIIIRDVVIFFSLLTIMAILVAKYIYRERTLICQINKIKAFNGKLLQQYSNYHDLLHKFRNAIFEHYRSISPQEIVFLPEHKKLFESICHSVTMELRNIFISHFKATDINIEDDISISIKITLTSKNILQWYSDRLKPNQLKTLKKNNKIWVLTVYRDPITFENVRDREVGRTLYDIDHNTAFIHILKEKKDHYSCDNLSALGENYLNENPKWHAQYNATMVVPIRYYNEQDGYLRYFGLIAIDSKNGGNVCLYTKAETKFMLGFAADLLANFFLLIALCAKTDSTYHASSFTMSTRGK